MPCTAIGIIKGQKGDKGPKGDKGDKGDRGNQGVQGPAGLNWDVTSLDWSNQLFHNNLL